MGHYFGRIVAASELSAKAWEPERYAHVVGRTDTIELPLFTEAVEEAQAEESLRKLQLELVVNPEKGDLIQGTGGFRKVRMRLPGKGKSGSARVIYIYFATPQEIYLAMLYKKSDRDTLSHSQKAALKRIAQQLRSPV